MSAWMTRGRKVRRAVENAAFLIPKRPNQEISPVYPKAEQTIHRFLLSLHPVKLFALILSFLLPFLSDGRTEVESSISEYRFTEDAEALQNREICIATAQGYAFAGNSRTNAVSVRSAQSFKRLNQPVRSSFRIVKGGKVIDNNHLHPYLARSFVHLAGFYISERYLLSICRLRL